MDFKTIVDTRYATKMFTGEMIDDEIIDDYKHLIRQSASSFGLQPYKIIFVKNKELKNKLQEASMNQPQVGTASHVLVFCADNRVMERIDQYEEMMKNTGIPEEKFSGYIKIMRGFLKSLSEERIASWAAKQTYIALGNAINGAKALGFDSCPMEGFNPQKVNEILDLPEHLNPTLLCPVGIAKDEMQGKLRYDDLFEER